MTIGNLRLAVQHLAFVVLTYGAHFKISLGAYVPCLSCPFIGSCSGGCYLMVFQRSMSWLFLPLAQVFAGAGSWAQVWQTFGYFLGGFAVFAVLVAILGKSWCGWICPFGLFQDWITWLRRALGLRESEILDRHKRRVSRVKYVLLAYLTVSPIAVSFGWLSRDFVLAFCNICPAKIIMPIFTGDIHHLGLNGDGARMVFSVLIMAITGGMAVGMFFKERFFCLVCPMLALINLLSRLHLLRLVKEPRACHGCGNCRRNCSMDNETIYRERASSRVYDPDCLGCFGCSESCASDKSLSVALGPLRLFSSSRAHAARPLSKAGPS
ncbi:MAG: 4Fe-4S binding protein [Deltaproteobacteria bacterium]|jgi:polyferredoxin|nr:4Fe-4S binding protein [Deltaproteobacteria bacterium]